MITDFQKRVYSLCRKVPKRKVTTYGITAKALSKKSMMPRAVGNALNKNPFDFIPCHRVVKSDGSIGGFASGSRKKISLLRKEGTSVKNNKIIDFKKRLYRFK